MIASFLRKCVLKFRQNPVKIDLELEGLINKYLFIPLIGDSIENYYVREYRFVVSPAIYNQEVMVWKKKYLNSNSKICEIK